ncbi:MAG: hypothetical protein K2J71_00350 [Oscillospiraceae bacterium]|nr:hypothetical protein [Oscillospiraceae bacterium]
MQDLIADYEISRQMLQKRIETLNCLLKHQTFQTIEREQLLARRDMLCKERDDITHLITDMRKHLNYFK